MAKASKLNGNWIVNYVEGLDVSERHLRIEIVGNTVFGQAPCNSFNASLILDDGAFNLGPLDLRRNVCDADTMDAELAYVRILTRLSNYVLEADGTLVLSSFGMPMISAIQER